MALAGPALRAHIEVLRAEGRRPGPVLRRSRNLHRVELTWAERVRGSLVGGAVGDALGAGIEFDDLARIRAQHGPDGVTGMTRAYGVLGAITDDTQMTLFTAEGLLRGQRGDVTVELWRAYSRWLCTQGVDPGREVGDRSGLLREPALQASRAPGNACLSGLREPTMGTRSRPANPDSKGCGTVMRSAPFGWLGGPAEQAWELAIDGAVLTHGHPTARFAAAAMAVLVHALVNGAPLETAVEGACDRLDAAGGGAGETLRALRSAVAADGPPTPEAVERVGAGWVGEEALAMAVFCALRAPDAPSALLAAVNHSGDSDSVGAICGNLVGAAHGVDALPTEWLTALEDRPLLERVADEVVEAFWA
jgi:ADP-ribosylglycohydrolase